jgi:hypothetical protein
LAEVRVDPEVGEFARHQEVAGQVGVNHQTTGKTVLEAQP